MVHLMMMTLILLLLLRLLLTVRDINNAGYVKKDRHRDNANSITSIKMVGLMYFRR